MTSYLTVSDWFCGAGGSSEGAVAANIEVKSAADYWQLALDTHNANHPDTDHYLTNLSQANPRYFPYTDIWWGSPECTNHSLSKGKKRKNLAQRSFFDPSKIDPSEERSRATMWCIPRFAEYHNYNSVIVENVVDVRYWRLWDAWIHAMQLMDYEYKICYFNSMFFHPLNGMTDYAPQSRDRIYIVFWKKGNKAPNLDFRPKAWCVKCEKDIEAIQSWKKPNKRWGRYGKKGQYLYRCPKCAEIVKPYYFAAWNCIDWSINAPRIGDRDRPLKPRTMERIKIGLEKYSEQPVLVNLLHAKSLKTLDRPIQTQTARQSLGLVVNLGHTHAKAGGHVRSLSDPMPTQTTAQTNAVIVHLKGAPENGQISITDSLPTQTTIPASSIIIRMKGDVESSAKDIASPLPAQTTVGAPFLLSYYTRESAHQPVDQPIGTISTEPRHALIMPQPFIASYYGGSNVVHGVTEELQTVTAADRHTLVTPQPKVEDCGFRMLQPHEIQDAMGFREDYILLGTKRQQVRLSGNAVTPPVAEWLYRQVAETFK